MKTPEKNHSVVGGMLAAALLAITTAALASTNQYDIVVKTPAGALDSLTFASAGGSCSNGSTWTFGTGPNTISDTSGTCNSGTWPSCNSGSFTQGGNAGGSQATYADSPLGCTFTLTPTIEGPSTTSNFNGSDLLTWDTTWSFEVAGGSGCTGGAFDCFSQNSYSPVLAGTLSLSGANYVGSISVSTSSATTPSFAGGTNCGSGSNAQAELNCIMGDLTGAVFDVVYKNP